MSRRRAAAVSLVAAGLVAYAFVPGTGPSGTPDRDRRAAPPIPVPAPARPVRAPALLESPQGEDLVAEAERALTARLGRGGIARFGEAVVVDPRLRVVCGEVALAAGAVGAGWKRYVSFGGTGIALVDDGSADFAEIHLSACASGPPRRQ